MGMIGFPGGGLQAPPRRPAPGSSGRPGEGAHAVIGRVASAGLDVTHGAILYLEGVTVSFDGFKALNDLSLRVSHCC